jgi:pimeloyl-ACP methyl ester carboxylesterase
MEINTRFVVASDGTRIAYDMQGQGPALVLLHPFPHPRHVWHEIGYTRRLQDQFTVITIDLRNPQAGESDKPDTLAGYAIEHYVTDIHAVADACGVNDFLLWGHSFGGNIATQASALSSRLRAAVIAGSFYGDGNQQWARQGPLVDVLRLRQAKADGTFDALPVEEREFAAQLNLDAELAFWQMFSEWPVREPQDARCPVLLYAGSQDTRLLLDQLEARHAELEQLGMQVHIFEGLNHRQELTEIDTVLPTVLAFLKRYSK